MDTISHMFWNGIIFKNSREKWNIIIGGALPDSALIISFVILSLGGYITYSKPWAEQILQISYVYFANMVLHSIPFWVTLFLVYKILGLKGYGIWLGAIIHVLFDVLTHRLYIMPYLWPISKIKPTGIVDYRTGYFTFFNWALISIAVLYLMIKRRGFLKKK